MRSSFAFGVVVLILLAGCSIALAQQSASANLTEEGLAEKEYDPTAGSTRDAVALGGAAPG